MNLLNKYVHYGFSFIKKLNPQNVTLMTRQLYGTTLLVMILIFASNSLLQAGAWTHKAGSYYAKVGFLRFKSTSQYLLNGDREPLSNNGEVVDFNFYQYIEYGLYDDLTVIGNVPLKRVNFSCAISGCDNTSSGLSDIYFGLRYRLSQQEWVVSLQSGFKLAPGYTTDEDELDSAPPLGDGQTDFEFRLLLGRPLFNHNGYLNLDAGYRVRSGEPTDEVPFSAELGINLSEHYLLVGKLHGVRGISEKSTQENFRIVDGRVENFVGTGALEDFVRAQAQFIYHIVPAVDISFEFDQVLTGRNTARASTIGFGIAFHK